MFQIAKINQDVNHTMIAKADVGPDKWDVDVPAGDCEDHALTKRSRLLKLDWPSVALSIAITKTAKGEAHAVLIVRIDASLYVLDNLRDEIWPLAKTKYKIEKMQGATPNEWIEFGHEA